MGRGPVQRPPRSDRAPLAPRRSAGPTRSLNRRILLEMTVRRAVVALACISVGIAVALLWDPTECMSTAMGCPPSNPNCNVVYCSHEYVPLRLAIAIAGVLLAVLVLTVRGRRPVQEDPAEETA